MKTAVAIAGITVMGILVAPEAASAAEACVRIWGWPGWAWCWPTWSPPGPTSPAPVGVLGGSGAGCVVLGVATLRRWVG